ncbi:MAG TPA: SDR family NAD(P)-dependent oxidoreductase [Streptosporangiaceae bacterium]
MTAPPGAGPGGPAGVSGAAPGGTAGGASGAAPGGTAGAGPGGAPGRGVLVTGGGTGIGAAVARTLAAGGDRVAILGRRPELLRAVAAETGALAVVGDVSDPAQVSSAVSRAVAEFGSLDGLVLNAGVISPGGVADLAPADWAAMVSVNLTGAFLVAQAALPHLISARGAIVSVASVAALRAASGMGGYAATKAGLTMLTQSIAVDHAHQGVRANVVCPGWTVTAMADEEMAALGAARALPVPEAYELVTALVPQRRPAQASEVAAVVAWLLSAAASYVNGAVIPVDGSASAVDVGTLAFDPRVQLRP